MAEFPGFDNISQAMSGLMDITGYLDGPPRVLGYAAGDQVSSISSEIALLLGVLSRYRTGKGQKVESSIYESLFHATNVRVILNQLNGRNMKRKGNASLYYAPCDTYATSDGGYVAIAVTRPEHWSALCNALNLGDMEQRFADNEARMNAYVDEIQPVISKAAAGMTAPELMDLLDRFQVPNGKVKTIKEAINSAITYDRDMLAVQPDPIIGPYIMPNHFIKHEDSENRIPQIPLIGADTKAFLATVGVDDKKYEELVEAGVVKF